MEQCGWPNQTRVYCITSPDQERHDPSLGEKLFLDSRLSEAEWNFWITQEPYKSLLQAIAVADREEFFFLTDRLPIILNIMAEYIRATSAVVHSLNEIVIAYRRITRVGGIVDIPGVKALCSQV
jgi:hypothetical protein